MENKPQEQKKSSDRHAETDTKINCWINSEASAHLTEVMQTCRLNKTEAVETILIEHGTSQALKQTQAIMPQEIKEICERCTKKGCPAYPRFDADAQEMLCVFTSEGKEPKILHRSLVEFEACSDSPILVSMARKRDLEQKFERETETLKTEAGKVPKLEAYGVALREMLTTKDGEHSKDTAEIYRVVGLLTDSHKANDKLTRQLQPMQTYITENKKLSNWRLHTANYLLRVLEERDALEIDNDFQRKRADELSHDKVVEKNAYLTVQLSGRDEKIAGLKTEIKQVQALNEVQERKATELISETRKMLTEFKQFLPSNLIQCQQCVDGTTMREYLRNIRKQINDFEGYLETTMPTPKDNLERFI
jgi:hypothetical protein